MTPLIEALRQKVLISFKEIKVMRQEIAVRLKTQSNRDRAEALSARVHQKLDSSLEGINPSNRHEIKGQLIQKYLIDEQRDIYHSDVLTIVSALPLPVEDQGLILDQWLSKTLTGYRAGDIHDYLYDTQYYKVSSIPVTKGKPFFIKNPLSVVLVMVLAIAFLMGGLIWTQTLNQTPVIKATSLKIERIGHYGLNNLYETHLNLIKTITPSSNGIWQLTYQPMDNPWSLKQTHFTYRTFDYIALRNYLVLERNSYLVSDDYLNEIIIIARNHDIDPLLLFAIIGQEQGFIPLDSEFKHLIVNNPFNVFYSWENYNTSLYDSTNFAVHLILDRLETLPSEEDALVWLNDVYAEDPNWSNGVQSLYSQLNALCRLH